MGKSFETEYLLKFKQDNKALLRAQAQTKGLRKNVERLRADFKRYGQQALKSFDMAAAGAVKFGKKLMLIGTLGLVAFAGLIAKTSQFGAKLEGYEVTLVQLYGNAKDAGEAMEWIMGLQVKTPYTPDELLGGLKQLKVFGMDARKWLPAIGDMASTMGLDFVEAARATAKAFSAGSAGADALRESYGATMANLVAISGFTEKELRGDMNKYREALFAFITDPKFKGGMMRFAATFKGVFSSIKGGLQTFLMYTGKAINDVMKDDFKKVVDWLVNAYESGKLQEWAVRVAEGFKMIWHGAKKVGETLWKFIKPIVTFFKNHPHLLKFAIAATAGGAALTLLGGGVMTVGGKLWQFGRSIGRGVGELRAFKGSLVGLFSTLKAGGGLAGLFGKGGLGQIGGALVTKGGMLGKIGGLLGSGGAAGTGGLAASLGAAIPIIGAVVAAGALFATAWTKNFANIREATQEHLISPLHQVLVDLGLVRKETEKTGDAGGVFKRIGSFFKEAWLGLAKVAAPVFKFLIKNFGAAIRVFRTLFAPVIAIVRNVLKVFRSIGGEAEGVQGTFSGLAKVVGWVFDKLWAVMNFIVKAFEATLGLVIKPMIIGIDWIGDKLAGLGKSKFVKNLKAGFEQIGRTARFVAGIVSLVWDKTLGKLRELFVGLVGKVGEGFASIGAFFSNLWAGIKSGISAVWGWLKSNFIDPVWNFFVGIWDAIKAPALAAWHWLKANIFDPIWDFVSGIYEGIGKFFASIADFFKGVGGKIAGWLGISKEDIKSIAEGAKTPAGTPAPGAAPGGAGPGDATAPIVPGAPGAGGGGAGGGGGGGSGSSGPTIQNNINHFHFTADAIKILTSKIDPQELLTLLGKSFSLDMGTT